MTNAKPSVGRSMKLLLRSGARKLFGLSVVRFPPVDSLQGHLKTFFRETGINCIIDVGAHRGEYGKEVREIGYKGRIVSFEPVRATYEVLSRTARNDRDWQAYPYALGDEAGDREIHLYQGTVFNSFLTASDAGEKRFGRQIDSRETERVTVRRLADMFDDCIAGIDEPRVFLKMDTQGWDLRVLNGGGPVLDKLVGIQSELPVRQSYEGMVEYTDALNRYAELGFGVTGIFPVTRETDELRVMEFDCVLIRHSVASGFA